MTNANCPHCGRDLELAQLSIVLPRQDTLHYCPTCSKIFPPLELKSPDVDVQGLHAHDGRLIEAFMQEWEQQYPNRDAKQAVKNLIWLAEKVDYPLHEASLRDFSDPANRPGRVLSQFLRWVDGESRHLD